MVGERKNTPVPYTFYSGTCALGCDHDDDCEERFRTKYDTNTIDVAVLGTWYMHHNQT